MAAMKAYDVIVIGGGPAREGAYWEPAREGAQLRICVPAKDESGAR
jgi:pyruvate/2-oxoglutarate dehydrogenase complex dihydrolipoamide dehydrogenase (E3) component